MTATPEAIKAEFKRRVLRAHPRITEGNFDDFVSEMKISAGFMALYASDDETISSPAVTLMVESYSNSHLQQVIQAIPTTAQPAAPVERRMPFETAYNNDRNISRLAEHLQDVAENWTDKCNFLAPYVAFVQSSGMGKTRAIYELGKTRYVLYFCVREAGSTGIPERTHSPSEFVGYTDEKWAFFFLAAIIALVDWITKAPEFGLVPSPDAFIKKVFATNGPSEWGAKVNLHLASVLRDANEWLLTSPNRKAESNSDPLVEYAQGRAREEFDKLSTICRTYYLQEDLEGKKPLVILAIDEARFMLGKVDPQIPIQPWPVLSSFRHALRAMVPRYDADKAPDVAVVAVLLDTASTVANFAPPMYRDPSARKVPLFLFDPCYFLDTIPRAPVNSSIEIRRVDDVVADGVVHGLSRPLFWSYTGTAGEGFTGGIALARLKLMGAPSPGSEIMKLNFIGFTPEERLRTALAIILPRSQFFDVEWEPVASDLLRGNMALCKNVSSDRTYMSINYITEPTLAEAARHFWAKRALLNQAFKELAAYCRLCMKGICGELVSMLTLNMAWDKCVWATVGGNDPSAPVVPERMPFSRPVPVKDFFNALFGKDLLRKGRKYEAFKWTASKQYKTSKRTADKAEGHQGESSHCSSRFEDFSNEWEKLEKGKVYVTHYTRITCTPTRAMLRELFIRGAGIVMKETEKGIDILIPVVYPGKDGSYALIDENFGAVCLQIKNRATEHSVEQTVKECIWKFRAAAQPNTNPIMSIVMELGGVIVEPKEDNVEYFFWRDSKQIGLHIRGFGPEIYPCLNGGNDSETMETMTHLRTLLKPVPDPKGVDTVSGAFIYYSCCAAMSEFPGLQGE